MGPQGVGVRAVPGHEDHGPTQENSGPGLPGPVIADAERQMAGALVALEEKAPVLQGLLRRLRCVEEAGEGAHADGLHVHEEAAQLHLMLRPLGPRPGLAANASAGRWQQQALHAVHEAEAAADSCRLIQALLAQGPLCGRVVAVHGRHQLRERPRPLQRLGVGARPTQPLDDGAALAALGILCLLQVRFAELLRDAFNGRVVEEEPGAEAPLWELPLQLLVRHHDEDRVRPPQDVLTRAYGCGVLSFTVGGLLCPAVAPKGSVHHARYLLDGGLEALQA
mmetsp:Transcript_90897/g.294112  ORF Transcript_90897/g.294112 Transcript_90897/m.294112 type:complete len:280 (+) Transcript_90897:590-1429(+)